MSMPFSNGGAGSLDAKEAVQPSAGNASIDSTFESRECPVEHRNNTWTLGATRFRSTLPGHHQEVYGQAFGKNGQVPNLVDLRNHLQVSWAMDFFTVPTLRFQTLYLWSAKIRFNGFQRNVILLHCVVILGNHGRNNNSPETRSFPTDRNPA
jgi:hypothetical protein